MAAEFVSAFRIVQPHWVSSAMDGEGARLYGGRWNPVGVAVVYLAESRSLAALEMLAHLTPLSRGLRYALIEVRFPESCVEALASSELPDNWQDHQPPDSLKRIGADWVASGSSLVFRVPSAVVAGEFNYLLNPAHPDSAKIQLSEPMEWSFDRRI